MKLSGIIVHGKHLGRTIGYPTANIRPDGTARFEKNGVYVAVIRLEGYPDALPCMLNQGRHPTVPDGPATIEAHILNFADDIYDLRAEVETLSFLRPEQNFGSLGALKDQLARDAAATQAWFDENGMPKDS